jgi:hypothetical protein
MLEIERIRANTRRLAEEAKTERAHRAAMDKPIRVEHTYPKADDGELSGDKRRR